MSTQAETIISEEIPSAERISDQKGTTPDQTAQNPWETLFDQFQNINERLSTERNGKPVLGNLTKKTVSSNPPIKNLCKEKTALIEHALSQSGISNPKEYKTQKDNLRDLANQLIFETTSENTDNIEGLKKIFAETAKRTVAQILQS